MAKRNITVNYKFVEAIAYLADANSETRFDKSFFEHRGLERAFEDIKRLGMLDRTRGQAPYSLNEKGREYAARLLNEAVVTLKDIEH